MENYKMSPEAKIYFDLWLKLDNLCSSGMGESFDADELRDTMDGPWYAMTETDIEQLEAIFREREGKNVY